jgi:hypothetical protein
VQLVGEVERELEVVVGQRVGGAGRVRGRERVRVAHERVEKRPGDLATWVGKLEHGRFATRLHAAGHLPGVAALIGRLGAANELRPGSGARVPAEVA